MLRFPPKGSGLNSAPNRLSLIFSFCSPTLSLMFPVAESRHDFVIRCKGCSENIPAPVKTLPASWIAAKCPLCGEHRRYLPSEVFQGRLSHQLWSAVTRASFLVGWSPGTKRRMKIAQSDKVATLALLSLVM